MHALRLQPLGLCHRLGVWVEPKVDRLASRWHHCHVTVLDPSIAGQLAEDLPRADFLLIINTFRDDLARLTQELTAAAATGDHHSFHRAAHSLAGAAAAVGALRLEASARLGMADEASTAPPPPGLSARIATEAQAALAALAALAQGPG